MTVYIDEHTLKQENMLGFSVFKLMHETELRHKGKYPFIMDNSGGSV